MAHRIIFDDEIDNQNLDITNLHEVLIIKNEEVEDNCSQNLDNTNSDDDLIIKIEDVEYNCSQNLDNTNSDDDLIIKIEDVEYNCSQNLDNTNSDDNLIIKIEEVEYNCSQNQEKQNRDLTDTNSDTECSTKVISIDNEGNIGLGKPKGKRRNKTELEMFGTDINKDDDSQDDVFGDKNVKCRKYKSRKTEQRARRGSVARSPSPLDHPSAPSTSSSSPASVRQAARTRRPRLGGRVRVRGGRTAAVEVAVVAADQGGASVSGRGRGGRGFLHERPGPNNIEDLQVLHVDEMPRGVGLEVPLHPRWERRRPPSDLARYAAQPAAPPPPFLSVMVPSAAAFVVCEQSASPPPSPPPAPPRRYSRNLWNDMEFLHYGSDLSSDEGGEDEDGGPLIPGVLTRTAQLLMDTPLDEDFRVGGGGADPGAPDADEGDARAPEELEELVEGVPLMATDQPRRWFDFDWKPFPDPPIDPVSRREPFSQINVGPTTPRDDPYDVFIDIWDRPIMEHIASETNRYAQQIAGEADNLHPKSRMRHWKPTDPDELYAFFGILLAMGVVVKSRLDEYWSSTADILSTPGFSAYMSSSRFMLLCKCLHFNNSELLYGLDRDSSEARLFKIQPILSHLNKKFQELYTPKQNLALDESLLMWKGWLEISQLIPNKAAKRGIKSYELCESQTGYLWRFEIHSHKKSALLPPQYEDPLEAPTPSIVLRLIQGLEHKGYTLWMDNFYNSPCLARRLKSLGVDCVGTLRTNRKFVPQALHNLTNQNMRPGQIVGLTSGDVDVMVWRDNNRVATISTYHGNSVQLYGGSTKPTLILDYNIMMGGVDKKDQLLAMYPVERKRTMAWYKKLFRRLLNVSVLNSYVIHHHSSSLTHRNFRISLIKSLLSRHRPILIPHNVAAAQNRRFVLPAQQVGEVYDARVHRIGDLAKQAGGTRRLRRNCVICKKSSTTICVGCDKTICITDCFLALHS